jgi:uncharacterized oxidoreductase
VKTTGNSILVTGGGAGIGLALAEVLLKAANEVIICGRREDRLQAAKKRFPKIHIRPCDLSNGRQRETLLEWTTENFPHLNILVNNAGIQRVINFKKGTEDWSGGENEIETNLQAPIHLAALFIPHLMKQAQAAIVNISSGLAFAPIAIMPVYCATKAAIHSFSLSLRHQLRDTSVKVFEVIPPMVDTGLDKGAREMRGQTDRGIQPAVVAQATLQALGKDDFETAVGQAVFLRDASRRSPDEIFERMNAGE